MKSEAKFTKDTPTGCRVKVKFKTGDKCWLGLWP